MSTSKIQYVFGTRAAIFVVSLFILWLSASTDGKAQNFWQQTDGPGGGTVSALAINLAGEIFAGTNGNGVFRSTNSGNSWTAAKAGMMNSSVTSLAINLQGYIFAGTYQGVFRSTDNGNSWTQVNIGLTDTNVFSIVIKDSIFVGTYNGVFRSTEKDGNSWTPANTGLTSTRITALTSRGLYIFAGAYGKGVFRSRDNGRSWTEVNIGLTTKFISALAVNASGHILAGTDNKGVFRSTDNGDTWTPINTGLTTLAVKSFAVNSAQKEIFLGTYGGGVFRSTDTDSSWTPVGLANTSVYALAINQVGYIFAGTSNGVFKSTDNGGSWASANAGLANTRISSLATNARGHIFAGTDHGVLRSTDNGNNWMPVNTGLTNTYVLSLAINARGDIFVGTTSFGVFRSTNNGDSWTLINTGLTGTSVQAFAINPNAQDTIFVAIDGSGVFRSTNNGDNWTPVNSGLTNTAVFSLAINSSGHIFAGTWGGGVFRSRNNGDSWMPVNKDLVFTYIRSLAINPSGYIFAGTGGGGVFRSINNGESWASVNNGLVNYAAQEIEPIAINAAGHIFVGRIGTFANPVGDGVFLSKNNGDSWMKVDAGLTNTTILSLAIDMNGYIYAGTNGGGVFRSARSTTYPDSYPNVFNLAYTVNYPSHPNASDYKPTDYRTVGLPGESNRRVDELLSGRHRTDWQVYRDNGAASNFFVEYDAGPEFLFSAGRAFWIIHKGPVNINTNVPPAPLDSSGSVEIPLSSGWNLVTNPFLSPVLWSSIKARNCITNPIWKYDGAAGFSPADTLKPCVGYYFDNSTNMPSLKILYLSSLLTSAAKEVDPVTWRVNIALSSGDFIDKATSFGASNKASPGLDRFDFRKPRAIATAPTVYFPRPNWDANYSTFATDIRPEIEKTESWEFEVRSVKREPSQLSFSGIGQIPARFEVYLIDEGSAQTINLREDTLYRFTPATEMLKFRVLVGKKEAVQEKLGSVSIPKEFALGHNFPNPFLSGAKSRSTGNPATTIPVAVPVTSEIKLKIYNLLGEEVKTIYAGQLEAGRYWFNWDGRNETGNAMASGVYLFRLTSNTGLVLTNKMTMIK